MSVSSLDDRRAARTQADEVTRCACGSEWFRLHGYEGEPPAVVMDAEGRITGYAGRLACDQCDRMQ